jgi:HAMP domain-containing protein
MSKRAFARSLYWRIGLGFIFFLAVTIVLQVALFIWVAGETEGGMPEQMGRDFAELVASEFESALARDPQLDLRAYAERRINELHRPAAIMFPDGSAIAPEGTELPRGMRFPGQFRRRGPGGPGGPGPGPGDRGFGGPGPDGPGPRGEGPRMRDGGGPPGPPPDGGGAPRMLGPPRRGPVMATIRQNDTVVAMVWVPPLTGTQRVAQAIGMPIAVGGLLLLIGATALATLVIFRPAQARLSALEEAARRFGDGDLSARAPAVGGDEVTAVATAFNRMASDLAARQAQLVEADRARRQLLADVSHELMTPLTAIRGYAETLALPQFLPSSTEGQRAVKVIQEEGERIERLVGDLLDLARFEARGLSLATELVDVDEIFERVSERHAKAAADKGVTIVVHPHDDAARTGGAEPGRQRAATHAAWRPRDPGRAAGRGTGAHHRCRQWRRHRTGAFAARVRPFLQGGSVTRPRRWIRPWPVDREGDHRTARRHRVGAQHSGRGDGVRDCVARPRVSRSQQRREYPLKQVGAIGEHVEQPAAIDPQDRAVGRRRHGRVNRSAGQRLVHANHVARGRRALLIRAVDAEHS